MEERAVRRERSHLAVRWMQKVGMEQQLQVGRHNDEMQQALMRRKQLSAMQHLTRGAALPGTKANVGAKGEPRLDQSVDPADARAQPIGRAARFVGRRELGAPRHLQAGPR